MTTTATGKNLRPGDAFVNADGTVDPIVDTYRPKAYPCSVGFVLENGERCTVGALGRVEVLLGASKADTIGTILDSPASYWDARPTSADLDAAAEELELCSHDGETVTRTAHGFLGDKPAGTVETLCADCGSEVDPLEGISDEALDAAEVLAHRFEELEAGRLCSVCGIEAIVRYVAVLPGSSLDPELGARCFEHRARSGEAAHAYAVHLGETVDTRPAPWQPLPPRDRELAVKVLAGGSSHIAEEIRLETSSLSSPFFLEDVLSTLVDGLRWTHPEHAGQAVDLGSIAVSIAYGTGATLIPAADGRDFDVFVELVREAAARMTRSAS